uniref:outer membrane protein assembly factor BamB n=1 Tax=Castellaniella defragrans TaxID=75697 RepID=UPI003341132E
MRTPARLFRIAALGLGLAVLSGCGMFSQTDPRYDPAPLTEYTPELAVAVRWSASIGSGGGYGFAPHAVGDSVYAATPSGGVAALALSSGAVRWQANVGKLSAGAGSDGRIVAVVNEGGEVIALDAAQGAERWRAQASSAVNIPPAVGNGIVAVRTTDYRVQAFDAETGKLRWDVQRPGPALALRTSMQMVMVQNVLITGMPNGRLMVLDAATGAVHWEGSVSASRGASDLERINDVVGAPLPLGPLLCGASYQGRIACFDVSQGGHLQWDRRISTATGMASDGQHIYVPGEHDEVFALDVQDGKEIWKQSALLNRRLSAPAIAGSAVVLGDYEGYLHFLSRADGRLMARLQAGGGAITSAPQTTDQGALVQTGGGTVMLVGVRD